LSLLARAWHARAIEREGPADHRGASGINAENELARDLTREIRGEALRLEADR